MIQWELASQKCLLHNCATFAIEMPPKWRDVSSKLGACLTDNGAKMSANMFMLNKEKPKLIIFKPKHHLKVSDKFQLQAGEKTVHVARSVKNLEVYFDTSLNTERQVNAISNACYSHIHNIGRIRQYITVDAFAHR